MKRTLFQVFIGISAFCLLASQAAAHCQIPCGIYDDKARVEEMLEHVETIQKSMNQIIALEKETPQNWNQLVRWVMNKEDHADKLQEIVTQYFMTQRIKATDKNYDKKLALLHQMLVYAMKCKQTTDLQNAGKLESLIKEFERLYFAEK